ncbi:MAG: hypothetical protein HRT73_11495 [Flavobacteriales bacterium]|nr:hypothetical protein [Flavobacteriales bacterium]
MENKLIIIAYAIYLPIALLLTFYVAKILFKNAKVFMLEIFHGKEEIALATNRLFEIGFYLMNIGFALLILKIRVSEYNPFETTQKLIETLSYKIGGFSIYLGIMLFLNLLLFFRGRRKANQSKPIIRTAIG